MASPKGSSSLSQMRSDGISSTIACWQMSTQRELGPVSCCRISWTVCVLFPMHLPALFRPNNSVDCHGESDNTIAEVSLANGREQCRPFADGPPRENDGQQCFLCESNVRRIHCVIGAVSDLLLLTFRSANAKDCRVSNACLQWHPG